jgi:GTPase SAR1 family protein
MLKLAGEEYAVSVVDTNSAPNGDGEILRSMTYASTNVVVICFAINNRKSFNDVTTIWRPEIKKYLKTPYPVILCGTKKDTRLDNSSGDESTVSTAEGEALSKDIGADGYVECSAQSSDGVDTSVTLAAEEARKFMYSKQVLRSFSSRLASFSQNP